MGKRVIKKLEGRIGSSIDWERDAWKWPYERAVKVLIAILLLSITIGMVASLIESGYTLDDLVQLF